MVATNCAHRLSVRRKSWVGEPARGGPSGFAREANFTAGLGNGCCFEKARDRPVQALNARDIERHPHGRGRWRRRRAKCGHHSGGMFLLSLHGLTGHLAFARPAQRNGTERAGRDGDDWQRAARNARAFWLLVKINEESQGNRHEFPIQSVAKTLTWTTLANATRPALINWTEGPCRPLVTLSVC